MKHSGSGFYLVATVNMMLLMSGVLPTPLYGLYETKFGLSPIEGTLIFSVYAIAVIPALFIFGPAGDKWGRKRILLSSVAICIFASIFLAVGDGLGWLIIGRALQGVAVGAAFGNATAAMVELEPSMNRKRASRAAGTSMFSGLIIGPLLSGFAVEYLPAPTLMIYLIDLALLGVVFVLLFRIEEPKREQKLAPLGLGFPRIPANIRLHFASASLSASLVFAMSALYFSVAPTYVQITLNTMNVFVGSAMTAIMAFMSILTQQFLRKINLKKLLVGGQIVLACGVSLIVLAQFTYSIVVLVVAALVSGVAYGATFLGAVAIINTIAPVNHRGNVISTFYALAYVAFGLPIIGLGFVTQVTNLLVAVQYYGVIMVIVALSHALWILLCTRSISE
jgi:MFS family permease